MKKIIISIAIGLLAGFIIASFVIPSNVKVVKEIRTVDKVKTITKTNTIYTDRIITKTIDKEGKPVEVIKEKIVEKPVEKIVETEKEKEVVKYDNRIWTAGIVVNPFDIKNEFGISAGIKFFNTYQLEGILLQENFNKLKSFVVIQILF